MVDSKYDLELIRRFITNYHLNKVMRGDGFQYRQQPLFFTHPVLVGASLVLGVVLAAYFHDPLLLFVPIFLVWFVPIIFSTKMLDAFRLHKKAEDLQATHERKEKAHKKADRQIREIEMMSSAEEDEEEQEALFELAYFGPLYGKEEVKRNLPDIMSIGRIADLEFIQELADDLGIRR